MYTFIAKIVNLKEKYRSLAFFLKKVIILHGEHNAF